MDEIFDYGTGVPYTHEDLEALFEGKQAKRTTSPSCSVCTWFDRSSNELCLGPATCLKWIDCGKCCPLTGRVSLVEFETCPKFRVDPIMCQ